MICEGRILEKFEGRSITLECRMWKILDAMNYHRRVMIGKRDCDLILSKEDNEYDFFDEEDPAPMIQICAYVDIKEVFTRKLRKNELVTFFLFPDMIGKELIILEIDSKRAYDDGVVFYHGNEKVWLADKIPTCYIKELY